ncbi:MAG: AAA family ATPase [Sandaracinus sp.]
MTAAQLPDANLPAEEHARLRQLARSFRERWPLEKLRSLTLEEYTNLEKDDSFTYWVESKLEDVGSIWGHSSFKFGIYERRASDQKASDGKHSYSERYAWRTNLGKTPEEAFAKVRAQLVGIAENAAAGTLSAIDDIDVTPLYRWKLAFLYQSENAGKVIPIFSGKALLELVQTHVDPKATRSMPRSARYLLLADRFKDIADPIVRGRRLWADYQARHGDEVDEEAGEVITQGTKPATAPQRARNLILYGPPGTGKTHATDARAVALAGSPGSSDVRAEYRRLRDSGRIATVTFHQSYGYEDFVEGLRPVLGEAAGDVRYELRPGVFKALALRAAAAGLKRSAQEPPFDLLWSTLLERVGAEDGAVFTSSTDRDYLLRRTARGNFESTRVANKEEKPAPDEANMVASKDLAKLWWDHREELGAPETVSYERARDLIRRVRGGGGGHHYTPLWILYRELLRLREELMKKGRSAEASEVEVQLALDGRSNAWFEFGADTPQFVLIIDEINRGNISKILGELITLLEPDRRLTAPGEMRVRLAGSSDHWFAVPPNLHIVGTMNTADRSIALMDVALRRRFELEEVMPDPDVVRRVLAEKGRSSAIASLAADLLTALNERIEILFDRDHVLGHAYFLEIEDLESLRGTFTDRILPLLSEYFYGRWDRIAAVLGCPYDEEGTPLRNKGAPYASPMIVVDSRRASTVLGYDASELEGRPRFVASPTLLRSGASKEELARLFVGVLALGREDHEKRVAEVIA